MPGATAGPQEKSPAASAHALGLAELPREGGQSAAFLGRHYKNFYMTPTQPLSVKFDPANFSKRREEIERVADVLKTRDQDKLQSIATNTRAKKVHLDPAELSRRWKNEAAPHLAGIEKVIRSTETPIRSNPMTPENALRLAVSHVFDRYSIVDERILLREALIVGRGDVALYQLKEGLRSKIESAEIIRSRKMVTTPEMLALEKSVVSWASQGRNALPPAGLYRADEKLSHEQNRAVEKLLKSEDRVSVLIGDAGAGKSTTLPAFIRGVHEAGGLTFACAPSSGAAMELQDKLKIQADTVQQLLVNEKLQEQVAGRTLLVDEAGLLSVRQMHELFLIAERQKCRVLLVGDVKQHHSVEAGDALRALQKYAGLDTIRLKEIHRQKEAEYKKVVKLLAEKKPGAAFTNLDRLGGVREEKDWNKLLDQAAASYVDKVAKGQTCLAISPVWSEVNALTAVLRHQLKEKGLLGQNEKTYKAVQSMQWTPAAKMQLSNYQVGDVLTFHRDSGEFRKHEMVSVIAKDAKGLTLERLDGFRSYFDPLKHKGFDVGLPRSLVVAPGEKLLVRANFAPSRLKNGDIVTVKEVKEDGSLELQDGRTIPAHFRQFTHGYASTSHSAQSKTVDHGILVLGDKSYHAANLQQAYVSNSRFRQTQTIFTTDKERAFDTMARFEERPLAAETIKPTTSEPPPEQEKGRVPVQKAEKVTPPAEQRNAESLDWNPVSPMHGIRV